MNTSTKVHENLQLENLPDEIWKDIPEYEGMYQVSSFGRVKSLSRKVKDYKGFRLIKTRIKKQHYNSNNYLGTHLNNNGVFNNYLIHHLVMMCFSDHKTNGYSAIIDHINNIKYDNRFINLQIISHRKNCSKDIDKSKTSSIYTGVRLTNNKLKWRVDIQNNKKSIYIGCFDNELYASKVYVEAVMDIEDNGNVIRTKNKYKKH